MSPEQATILIVEDDHTLARGLEMNLRAEGFRVLLAAEGDAGLRLALDERPDLVVLDLMLPDLDGFEVLSELRGRGRETPVIILSARGAVADKVDGLGLGADDYVTKPFSMQELSARIHAALARPTRRPGESRTVRFGPVEVDLDRRRILRSGVEVKLTGREFDLLEHLITHPGRVHGRDQLLEAVWGYDYEGTARTVDNFVRNLRSKLEEDPARPRHLLTVRGVGYRFEV